MRLRNLLAVGAICLVAACSSNDEITDADTMDGSMTTESTTDVTGSPMDGYDAQSLGAQDFANGAVPGSQQDLALNVGDRIFFAYDSSALSAEARTTLERQAQWLARYPSLNATVEGHCDERGTREYNLALGERRASAVRDYLVALGVSASRLNTVSYGKERPAVLGSDASSWAQNRRGVLVVE